MGSFFDILSYFPVVDYLEYWYRKQVLEIANHWGRALPKEYHFRHRVPIAFSSTCGIMRLKFLPPAWERTQACMDFYGLTESRGVRESLHKQIQLLSRTQSLAVPVRHIWCLL